MRIVIAPDKFKHALSAPQVAVAIAAGIRAAAPDAEIDLLPMADGGEGTVAALVADTGGRLLTRRVTGPLPDMKVDATFGILGDGATAVIETAAASGLHLLAPQDRNPLNTTTFGTGQLIAAAIREGATRIILGLGGSATNDLGIGCCQACGFTVLRFDGEPTSLTEPLCGRDLPHVLTVKHGRGEVTNGIELIAACDVNSPLLGPTGAAAVFAPQKGATPAVVEQLDAAAAGLVARNGWTDQASVAGAGAAGGLGFAVNTFFRGSLRPGFSIVADAVRLGDRLAGADLCITGEGRLDESSLSGKTAIGVSRLCRALGVRCLALVGQLAVPPEHLRAEGIDAAIAIGGALSETAARLTMQARALLVRNA